MARYIDDYNRFRPIIQKVLPLVYDESLSYYEILCKIIWWIEHNKEDIEAIIDEKLEGITGMNNSLVRPYEDIEFPTKVDYTICSHENKIYLNKVVITDPEEFKPSKWEEIVLADFISDTNSETQDMIRELSSEIPELPEINLPEDVGKVLYVKADGTWGLKTPFEPEGTADITTNGVHDIANFRYAKVNVPTGDTPTGTLNIAENGTFDVTNYASAEVDVPASEVDSGSKSINSNGTHDVIGYANAEVNVPASAVDVGSKNITENGTHDVVGYANVNVDVPTGITPAGTVNIANNGTFDVSLYANANVNVPASAVDSGSKNIVTNGTHDVTGYASANVNVPASAVDSGTKTVTQNGTFDVVGYANVNVNVPGAVAAFPRAVNVSIAYQNYDSEDPTYMKLWYRGYDETQTNRVVWKYIEVIADGTSHTYTITLCPSNELFLDGFYLEGYDGVSLANVICVRCAAKYMTQTLTTGSEHIYIVVTGDNPGIIID